MTNLLHSSEFLSALAGAIVAALAAGVAVVPLVGVADEHPGVGVRAELTRLIQLYRERLDVLNYGPALEDKAANKVMDALRDMLEGMIGVPVRSRAEAVMAINFVFEDSEGSMIDFSHGPGPAYEWLLKSARDYFAEEVRS